jgi:YD repeat-containing protein
VAQSVDLDFSARRREDLVVRFPVEPPAEGESYGDWYEAETQTGVFRIPCVVMVDEVGEMISEVENGIVDATERGDWRDAMQLALNFLVSMRTPDAPELRFDWGALEQIVEATSTDDGTSPLRDVVSAVVTKRGIEGEPPLANRQERRSANRSSDSENGTAGGRTGGETSPGGSVRRTSRKPQKTAR